MKAHPRPTKNDLSVPVATLASVFWRSLLDLLQEATRTHLLQQWGHPSNRDMVPQGHGTTFIGFAGPSVASRWLIILATCSSFLSLRDDSELRLLSSAGLAPWNIGRQRHLERLKEGSGLPRDNVVDGLGSLALGGRGNHRVQRTLSLRRAITAATASATSWGFGGVVERFSA